MLSAAELAAVFLFEKQHFYHNFSVVSNLHDKDFNIQADCMFCYQSFRVCEIFTSLNVVEAVSMSESVTSRALPT